MPDRLQTYRNRVSDAVDSWQANVCNPYIIAYNTAFRNYNEAFNRQKESDKARAELFVSAASILPGSILMATAASSSLRVLANRAALNMLAKSNLTRTLSIYKAASENATAAFATGKLLDMIKDATGGKIKDAVIKATSLSDNMLASDPLNRDKQLNTWLTNHKLCAFEAAEAIENSPSGDAEKDRAYAALRQAPVANKPQGALNPGPLALKIELGFYMMALLESDELVTMPPQMPGSYGTVVGMKSRPIEKMPSAKDYPRAVNRGSSGTSQWVGIARPGGEVEDRIDEVSKKVRSRAFYAPSGLFGKPDTRKMQELRDAEAWLNWLADATRPLNPLGLRT